MLIQDSINQMNMKIGRAHVLNSSHLVISYAVFCLKKNTAPTPRHAPHLPVARHRRGGAVASWRGTCVVGRLRMGGGQHLGRSSVVWCFFFNKAPRARTPPLPPAPTSPS